MPDTLHLPDGLEALHGAVRDALRGAGFGDAGREARQLIAALTDVRGEDFLMRPELTLPADALAAVEVGLAKRLDGMPIGRLAGVRSF
ncbi:MAG: hypothetical protein KKB37_05145, partial [Alphaproteobacteria bacterium]|nr:hypothetical protein [Alphaproteobacteria bacterium]